MIRMAVLRSVYEHTAVNAYKVSLHLALFLVVVQLGQPVSGFSVKGWQSVCCIYVCLTKGMAASAWGC